MLVGPRTILLHLEEYFLLNVYLHYLREMEYANHNVCELFSDLPTLSIRLQRLTDFAMDQAQRSWHIYCHILYLDCESVIFSYLCTFARDICYFQTALCIRASSSKLYAISYQE